MCDVVLCRGGRIAEKVEARRGESEQKPGGTPCGQTVECGGQQKAEPLGWSLPRRTARTGTPLGGGQGRWVHRGGGTRDGGLAASWGGRFSLRRVLNFSRAGRGVHWTQGRPSPAHCACACACACALQLGPAGACEVPSLPSASKHTQRRGAKNEIIMEPHGSPGRRRWRCNTGPAKRTSLLQRSDPGGDSFVRTIPCTRGG